MKLLSKNDSMHGQPGIQGMSACDEKTAPDALQIFSANSDAVPLTGAGFTVIWIGAHSVMVNAMSAIKILIFITKYNSPANPQCQLQITVNRLYEGTKLYAAIRCGVPAGRSGQTDQSDNAARKDEIAAVALTSQ